MKLYVYVLEAKGLQMTNAYVKLRVGKIKCKTRILRGAQNPVWNEEFVFRVHDGDEDLLLSVFHPPDDFGLFSSRDCLGKVGIPVWSVAAEDKLTFPPTWFSLESPKSGKFTDKDCGKILLTVSLHGRNLDSSTKQVFREQSNACILDSEDLEGSGRPSEDAILTKPLPQKITEGRQMMKNITTRIENIFGKSEVALATDDSASELSPTVSEIDDSIMEESQPSCIFIEGLESMQSRESGQETPENLKGGVLLDQAFEVSANELNKCLFKPNSQFKKELAEHQGAKDIQEGPWTWKPGNTCLTRVVTYTNPATRLVKAVKATEEQTYIKVDANEFSVIVSVSTPDVPYGGTFKVELLYKIFSGPELSSGEESSRLVVSWAVNFIQGTIMKGMIEGGVKQGLTESFGQFTDLLSQNYKMVDAIDALDKDQVLATLQTEHQSDWELASEYFWNFTIVSTIFVVLYFLFHILLRESGKIGLEFNGLDLPDSFGELITCGILATQLERAYNMISHFIQARWRRGSDHGVKAQGDGWVLTVALIEGANIASPDSTEFSDPYVVFTCNCKTRTSSVKLQTRDPQWKEILEFDAVEEPPSVLDLEVYDFDGPFDQAMSLGHAEINFLKHTSTDLADIWVSLEGKPAHSSESKIHMRIFLDNNKGVDTIKEYLSKMEKEVGKKLNQKSPRRISAFQKLFGLPREEFLVCDFTCQLKRKLPLQGRIFLSARIVGFYGNLFGYKTKFFLLWDDIENIQILPPTLAAVGSPSLVLIVRKGRGLDAKHGAKFLDDEGRLRFFFQSFPSFTFSSRTILALWRTRILAPHREKDKTEQEEKLLGTEDGLATEAEDDKRSKIYQAELSINMNLLMSEMFGGGKTESKIMEKSGCLNYTTTKWEATKDGVLERCISYKFNRQVSVFGGEVSSVQQKSPIIDEEGWILDEVMGLHNVPFSDYFKVHFQYKVVKFLVGQDGIKCEAYIWITWLKSSEFKKRIIRNVVDKFSYRLKEIFELAEREIQRSTEEDEVSLD